MFSDRCGYVVQGHIGLCIEGGDGSAASYPSRVDALDSATGNELVDKVGKGGEGEEGEVFHLFLT
jgi:hypothetical protein